MTKPMILVVSMRGVGVGPGVGVVPSGSGVVAVVFGVGIIGLQVPSGLFAIADHVRYIM